MVNIDEGLERRERGRFPEAKAHASAGTVWALLLPRPDTPRELKIVWRATGSGALAVTDGDLWIDVK